MMVELVAASRGYSSALSVHEIGSLWKTAVVKRMF